MSIYQNIGLDGVINCSGKMTKIGVSVLDESVTEAMNQAGHAFVVTDDLLVRAGELISDYMKTEATCVTNSASAGIALSVASVIAGENLDAVEALPGGDIKKREIIIQKGHAVNFGAPITSMIRVGGGIPVEAGHANKVEAEHVRQAINENTAALIYVKSHHCVQKGMLDIDEMHAIAREFDLPFIVDAAAEEDFLRYTSKGYEMVIFSGAKALEGPTSGFITGKKAYIYACLKQYVGVGRAMKVGKENVMGLLKAIENYFNKDAEMCVENQKRKAQALIDSFNRIEGLRANMIQDEAGRAIFRALVHVNLGESKSAKWLNESLRNGNPKIYVRDHKANIGQLSFDVRSVTDAEIRSVCARVQELANQTV